MLVRCVVGMVSEVGCSVLVDVVDIGCFLMSGLVCWCGDWFCVKLMGSLYFMVLWYIVLLCGMVWLVWVVVMWLLVVIVLLVV